VKKPQYQQIPVLTFLKYRYYTGSGIAFSIPNWKHYSEQLKIGSILKFRILLKVVELKKNVSNLINLFFALQEFIRVGYYVSNEYDDDEMKETPPETPVFDHLTRNILASNPRVTKFKINWDNPNSQVRLVLLIKRL
jgi:hypothetical protein